MPMPTKWSAYMAFDLKRQYSRVIIVGSGASSRSFGAFERISMASWNLLQGNGSKCDDDLWTYLTSLRILEVYCCVCSPLRGHCDTRKDMEWSHSHTARNPISLISHVVLIFSTTNFCHYLESYLGHDFQVSHKKMSLGKVTTLW